MVNRREFFSKFFRPGPGFQVSEYERRARRRTLETFVQTQLLPTDFALTQKEKSQLASRVRAFLEQSSDEALFSSSITNRLRKLVDGLVDAFRMASAEVTPERDPQAIRKAAVQSAALFLGQAEGRLDAMMTRTGTKDRAELEEHLKKELVRWSETLPDAEVLRYDQISIREPAFEQLHNLVGPRPLR